MTHTTRTTHDTHDTRHTTQHTTREGGRTTKSFMSLLQSEGSVMVGAGFTGTMRMARIGFMS